jgi:hypothetical protein
MAEISNPKIKVDLKDNTKAGTQSVINNLDKIEKKSSALTKAFSNIKMGLFGAGIAGVTSKIIQATKKSSDFIEQLNVLDVAFNDNTTGIRKFTSNIAETLNLDDASIIKMASSFKILGNSMGYADEMGTKFSKLMTSITTDTASLFNMSLSDTQAMLQSAVQGQTKTLRMRTGVSILDRDVQTTLDVLGIDAYVENMNSAEKSLARVITMTYRLRESQGDLARTIEAPANQFRVLGEQISLLARNIGNVFLPIIAQILPYLNAILIVLNKLISSLASLLGFRENAWDTYKKQADNLSNAFDDFGTSVGGVGTAAKKAKKELSGLREFDKLNVIKTPTDTSSGGGGGGGAGTGINPNLLKAFDLMFDNYNSLLDGVETKATKIAKAIMKALGDIDFSNLIASGKRLWAAFKPFAENVGKGLLWTFENVLVPIGKWYIEDYLPAWLDLLASGFKVLNSAIKVFKPMAKWLFENFLSPLAKFAGKVVVNWMKGLTTALENISKKPAWSALTVGAGAILLLATNWTKLKNAVKNTKIYTMFDDIKKGIGTYKKLNDSFGDTYSSLDVLKGGIQRANIEWRKQQGIIDENTGKFKSIGAVISGAFSGLVTSTMGITAVNTAFDDIAEHGLNLTNVLGGLSGSVATVYGAMQIGASIFPKYGLAIGAVVGVVGLAITAFSSFINANKDATAGLEEFEKAQKRLDDATRDKLETDLVELDHIDKLSNELGNLVDANGKVKDGYEKRVNYILNELNEAFGTEYKLIDGVITKNGKAVKSYQEVEKEIQETIKWKRAEAVQEAFKEDYIKALKNEKKLKEANIETEKAYNEQLEKLRKKYGDIGLAILTNTDMLDEQKAQALHTSTDMIKYDQMVLDNKKNQFEAVKKGYKENEKIIGNYEKLQEAIVNKDWNTTLKYLDNYIDTSKIKTDEFNRNVSKTSTDLATSLSSIFDKVPKTKTTKVKIEADTSSFTSTIKNAFKNIKIGSINLSSLFKADGGILVNGKWRDIAQYDTGGLPPTGQLFVARERGAELVGNIGGHTAVMNNNQIVSSVSAGVYQAVKGAMGNMNNNNGVYNIYLDKDHKLGSYTLEQLQGMAKSNGKPITIG